MTTLTIRVPDSNAEALTRTATDLGVPVEAVVARSIDEFLQRRQRIRNAMDEVLTENEELYRRLAQ